MKAVVLSVSGKWQNEEVIRGVLRKLHDAAPDCQIRMASRPSGMAKAARDFAQVLGFTVREYPNEDWFNFASEIRNQTMLDGIHRDPHNPQIVKELEPRADLLIAFWCGTTDNTDKIVKKRLGSADPVVIYREKWRKPKSKYKKEEPKLLAIERAATDKKKPTKLTDWRKHDVPGSETDGS